MTAKIDLTGKKFGTLLVLQENKDKKGYWDCLCDCGNKKTIKGGNLRSGNTKTCGDRTKHKMNLIGRKFGRLTVIRKNPIKKGNKIQWDCICDCGNKITTTGDCLRRGHTKSCGCLSKEKSAETGRKRISNIIGQKFNKLTVLEATEKRINEQVVWKCQCECGNIHYVATGNLKTGAVASCGCLGRSKGENIIETLLNNNNINFIQEKKFESCHLPGSNQLLRFDFYIPEKNYLIEYDGIQHFNYQENGGWNTKENFEKTQRRDKFKNQWCKENNIPLIRIPYTREDDLCIEDLLLETSKFIYEEKI